MKKILSFVFACLVFTLPAFACNTNEIDVLGDGTQCQTAHFTLTTTSTNSFQFSLSAAGTFYVDCGNGGTLSGTNASGKIISRGSSTTNTTYSCSWGTSTAQTVRFGGTATDYNTSTSTAAISFYTDITNAQKVYSITGDLGKIFGAVQSNQIPRFQRTFYSCSKLTTIPSGLFDSVDTSNATDTSYMFNQTFRNCSGLTAISTGLFDSINTSNATHTSYMFSYTFSNCSGLTAIPTGLFDSINTSNATNTNYMFQRTFYSCSKLTTIPTGLFDSINTSNATNTSYMFYYTFYNCSNLTDIPSGLFNSIDTSNATNTSGMFQYTFSNCSGLTSMPATLFNSNIGMVNGAIYTNMFSDMFYNCTNLGGYIPSTTFPSGITTALNASIDVFLNTKLATECPAGTTLYATYTPNSKVACEEISGIDCSSGYYLPANVNECTQCPANSACVGGTYSFNETMSQGIEPCATGYSSVAGASVCTANTINITWDNANTADITANNAGSVTYGGDIRTPRKAQHINGKIFVGWTFNNPE